MKQKLILTLSLLVTAFVYVRGEEVALTANAPNAIVMGETFRVAYTVNTHNARNFRMGNVADFDIITVLSKSNIKHLIPCCLSSSKFISYTFFKL